MCQLLALANTLCLSLRGSEQQFHSYCCAVTASHYRCSAFALDVRSRCSSRFANRFQYRNSSADNRRQTASMLDFCSPLRRRRRSDRGFTDCLVGDPTQTQCRHWLPTMRCTVFDSVLHCLTMSKLPLFLTTICQIVKVGHNLLTKQILPNTSQLLLATPDH